MYLIDKPLYAIELPDGSLAEDMWTRDHTTWITFSLIHAEKEVTSHYGGKIVIYSQWWEEKTQREAAQREQMNPTSNGDNFPVVEPAESPYRFVLVDNSDGNIFCHLTTEYVSDRDIEDSPDVWASNEAACEALRNSGLFCESGEEMITLTKEEYDYLMRCAEKWEALDAAGVA
jgi:hypothetical protein